MPRIVHQQPFFGNPSDAPRRPAHSAGLEFRIPTAAASELPPFGGRVQQSWKQRLIAAARESGDEVQEQGVAADVVLVGAHVADAPYTRNGRRAHRFTPATRCGHVLCHLRISATQSDLIVHTLCTPFAHTTTGGELLACKYMSVSHLRDASLQQRLCAHQLLDQ